MLKPEKIGKLGQLYVGDCVENLKSLPDNSVTGICADPPSGISFMNANWDSNKGGRDQWISWLTEVMTECLRILKPGGMAFIWAIPRTSHWTATAIENAGFEIREKFYHMFGQGFPKSTNISKKIDEKLGKERKVVGKFKITGQALGINKGLGKSSGETEFKNEWDITEPASEEAKLFEGYGTATKPAVEEWVLAMKPIEKNFTNNALVHGVAGINIDAGRIGLRTKNESGWSQTGSKASENRAMSGPNYERPPRDEVGKGRWPSNLILSHHPECKLIGKKKVKGVKGGNSTNIGEYGAVSVDKDKLGKPCGYADENGNETIEEYSCHPSCPIFQLNQQVGIKKSGTNCVRTKEGFFLEHGGMGKAGDEQITYGDTGYVSRYFLNLPPETQRMVYSSKASKRERNKGCENLYWKRDPQILISKEEWDTLPENERSFGNIHNTVKPLSFIKYLVSLLKMPQNTLLLDMFAGSGTMGVACEQLKIPYILMEKEEEYCDIIRCRVKAANEPDKPIKTKKKTPKPTNTLMDWDELEIEEEL